MWMGGCMYGKQNGWIRVYVQSRVRTISWWHSYLGDRRTHAVLAIEMQLGTGDPLAHWKEQAQHDGDRHTLFQTRDKNVYLYCFLAWELFSRPPNHSTTQPTIHPPNQLTNQPSIQGPQPLLSQFWPSKGVQTRVWFLVIDGGKFLTRLAAWVGEVWGWGWGWGWGEGEGEGYRMSTSLFACCIPSELQNTVYMCVYIYLYVYVSVCVYICICMCMYRYVYILYVPLLQTPYNITVRLARPLDWQGRLRF